VVSNNKSLRVVELKDRLTNTQRDIFTKWSGVASLEREQLHLTIWESFKLKSINEAFYKGIANSFKELVSHLEAAGKSANEARHFANRLHGRLLFCWFLDKKGFINREVGYFNIDHTDATQYYKDKLELLFFDTLNTPQPERERSHPDQKTPYLNGGLFEAQPDDWRGSNVPFPAGFFVRLYEHFGEFNFTTDESTPDYEQIAIDPEMLGKIFENLLAEINEDTGEQARKAKGAFYTPREIVAYMCRASVREYLYTATKAGDKAKTSIDKLLDTSDSDWAKSGTNSKRDAVEPALREKIVKALDEMKVLDPACGSGAFPIGMLHLLVQIYERLDTRFDPYRTKLGIMERNIYGVDIEPLAIEIARLRSFLALVVDQEYVEKKPNGGIDTLPNLEFKFVCANTLIPLTRQSSLGDSGKYETLLEIKKEYFKATPKQREKLETRYSTLRQQGTMFDSKLNEQLQTYDPFNNDHPASFYDQHLMHDISEAFSISIGNPPYVQLQKNKGALANMYEHVNYATFARTGDLYALFYERGLELTKSGGGLLCYITSNKWMRAGYGEKLRSYFGTKDPVLLIDFGGFKVFESATVDTNILLVRNDTFNNNFITCHMKNDFVRGNSIADYVQAHSNPMDTLTNGPWFVGGDAERSLKAKIECVGTPLKDWDVKINYGIKTGLNEAFIIDDEMRDKLIAEDPKNEEIIKPILRGKDIKRYSHDWQYKWLLMTGYDMDIPKLYPIVYKYLKEIGDLIESGKMKVKGKGLYNRDDQGKNWWNLRACDYYSDFATEKIFWSDIATEPSFSLAGPNVFANNTIYMITGPDLPYLISILNSPVIKYYFPLVATDLGENGNRYFKQFVELLPIPEADSETKNTLGELARALTMLKQDIKDTASIEQEINHRVYRLYSLTPEEIALIEHG
jgi:methylase of polypeptide subunit release factors